MTWANEIIQKIKEKGYWADAADPCSGMPVHSSRGPTTFDDVSAHNRLLGYHISTVGGASGIPCKVVSSFSTSPLPYVNIISFLAIARNLAQIVSTIL
jgi:hypothetical protein